MNQINENKTPEIDDLQLAKSLSKRLWTLKEVMNDKSEENVIPLVEGLLAKQEFVILTAPSKSNKTWFTMELALAVAEGRSFLGKYPTYKGKVLYCEFELSLPRLRERFQKVVREPNFKSVNDENLFILKERFYFDQTDPQKLIDLKIIIASLKPDLIIFDPLFCLHRADENSAKDMLPILMEFKDLTSHMPSKPAVLLVHHTGKKGESTGHQVSHQSRGSSAMGDVPDATWVLKRTSDNAIKQFAVEQRYGAPVEPIDLKFDYDKAEWTIIGNSQVQSKGSIKDLVKILSGYDGADRPTLMKHYCEEFQCSERTFDSRLQEALRQRVIVKSKMGKTILFIAAVANSQELKGLQDCNDDNFESINR